MIISCLCGTQLGEGVASCHCSAQLGRGHRQSWLGPSAACSSGSSSKIPSEYEQMSRGGGLVQVGSPWTASTESSCCENWEHVAAWLTDLTSYGLLTPVTFGARDEQKLEAAVERWQQIAPDSHRVPMGSREVAGSPPWCGLIMPLLRDRWSDSYIVYNCYIIKLRSRISG